MERIRNPSVNKCFPALKKTDWVDFYNNETKTVRATVGLVGKRLGISPRLHPVKKSSYTIERYGLSCGHQMAPQKAMFRMSPLEMT